MRGAFVCAGLLATALLVGCQTSDPVTRYTVAAADMPLYPIAVPVAVTQERRAGPMINQLGGEIPEAKPTTPVGDGGLGEVR